MPGYSTGFALSQIITAGAVAFVIALVLLLILRWRFPPFPMAETGIVALVAGLSVLVWRLAGNVSFLNDDTLPYLSPNDFLCPIFTYVFLGLYAAVRYTNDPTHWRIYRALLTLASFFVNVLVI